MSMRRLFSFSSRLINFAALAEVNFFVYMPALPSEVVPFLHSAF